METFFVYILANRSGTLYIGVTNDLRRRLWEHRHCVNPGFTSRYNIRRLIYFETTHSILSAIRREKQLKGWKRERKIALVNAMNPGWKDLSEGWYDGT